MPDGATPARRRSLRIEELADRRVVTLQRGSGFRRHVESIYAAAGLQFRPAVEVGSQNGAVMVVTIRDHEVFV